MKAYINLLFNEYFIVSSIVMSFYTSDLEKTYNNVVRDMKRLSLYIFSENSTEQLSMLARKYNSKTIYYSPDKDGIPVFENHEDAEKFKHIIDCKLLLVSLRDN